MTSSKQKHVGSAKFLSFAVVGFSALTACMPRGITTEQGSKLADILMTLPSDKDASGNLLFDSYSVRIRTTTPQQKTSKDEACTNFELGIADMTVKIPAGGKISDLKVSDACDYVMTVELGLLAGASLTNLEPKLAAGNNLMLPADKVRYSSDQPDLKKFITISSTQLKAAKNSALPVDVEVFKVDGRVAGPDSLFSSGITDLNIDIRIGNKSDNFSVDATEVIELKGSKADEVLKLTLANLGQGRRVVVLFGMKDCTPCMEEAANMRAIVTGLKADNKTIFVHHESTQAAVSKSNWSLGESATAEASFPYTYIYENGNRKEIKSTRGKALSKDQLVVLANGGTLE